MPVPLFCIENLVVIDETRTDTPWRAIRVVRFRGGGKQRRIYSLAWNGERWAQSEALTAFIRDHAGLLSELEDRLRCTPRHRLTIRRGIGA